MWLEHTSVISPTARSPWFYYQPRLGTKKPFSVTQHNKLSPNSLFFFVYLANTLPQNNAPTGQDDDCYSTWNSFSGGVISKAHQK